MQRTLVGYQRDTSSSQVDYTNCVEDVANSQRSCAEAIFNRTDPAEFCQCRAQDVTFELEEDWKGEVFMYYYLTNFYQNHR